MGGKNLYNVVFGRMEQGLGLKLRNCLSLRKGYFLAIKVVHSFFVSREKVEICFVLFLWSGHLIPIWEC